MVARENSNFTGLWQINTGHLIGDLYVIFSAESENDLGFSPTPTDFPEN